MANTLITPGVIAKEALMQLENNMVMGNLVHRAYKKEFVKIGSTVSIRKPVKFVASDGATRVNQNVSESTTSIVIDKRKHVSWKFSSEELTLTVKDYSERYVKPAMIALSNVVDSDLCSLYKKIAAMVGTAGSTPSSFATSVQLVGTSMDDHAVPRDGRKLVLNPDGYWTMLGGQTGLYQSSSMVEGAYRNARLGIIGGYEIFQDQNIKTHTRGTADVGTVAGADQIGSTVNLAAMGISSTWKEGDFLTMAGCYDVNPISGEALDYLKAFVITADATSAAAETATVSIYPSIIITGAYKTCSAAPTNGGVATVFTANSVNNLAFVKQAFALVMVPLEMPDGAAFKARESHSGMSVRVIKSYDVDTDDDIIRLDIMYGVKAIYPELAVRLLG